MLIVDLRKETRDSYLGDNIGHRHLHHSANLSQDQKGVSSETGIGLHFLS